MIPKVIHYCWFSGEEKPKCIQRCIDSWSKVMPDYVIRCWGAGSFDFDRVPFVKEAYSKRKWAFMADYVRLYALYTEGGIYLDSDVMVFKRFDDFLSDRMFIGTELGTIGNDSDICIDAAICGAEAGHPFLKECLDYYDTLSFIRSDGSINNTPMPRVITPFAIKYGFVAQNREQLLEKIDIHVYPTTHFTHICDPTVKQGVPDSLYALHCLNHSWIDTQPGFTLCKCLHLTWLHPFLLPLFRLLKNCLVTSRLLG